MIWGAIFVFDARNKNDKRIEYRSGGKTSMMMSNDIGIDPVSYTHLDVYKRQAVYGEMVLGCWRFN